eukprot:1459252-Prorocentrum_lima.AAC.1
MPAHVRVATVVAFMEGPNRGMTAATKSPVQRHLATVLKERESVGAGVEVALSRKEARKKWLHHKYRLLTYNSDRW